MDLLHAALNVEDTEAARRLVKGLHPSEVADATRALAADDSADTLQDLPDEVADTILQVMDAQNRQRLADVLTYPEDNADGLMDTDVVSVRADVSLDVVVWFGDSPLGLIIGVAMIINLLVAALAGALIPVVLKRYGIDPAIAGGVILTTVTDVVGFMTFLGLATIFLIA